MPVNGSPALDAGTGAVRGALPAGGAPDPWEPFTPAPLPALLFDGLVELTGVPLDSSLSDGTYDAGLPALPSLWQPGSAASIRPSPSLSTPSEHCGPVSLPEVLAAGAVAVDSEPAVVAFAAAVVPA